MQLACNISGMREVRGALASFKQREVVAVARDAVDQLTAPIVAEIAQACPVDTGALQRSIGRRRYTKGSVILVVIGPRRGEAYGQSRSGENPSRYAHMVEFYQQPFMRPVWDAHKATLITRLAALVATGLRARGMA